MPNKMRIIRFPGTTAHWVGHPTELDPVGQDGLYVHSVFVTDLPLFMKYCNFVCRPVFLWSPN